MSDSESEEFSLTGETVYHIVESDGAKRAHLSFADLATDIRRILEQGGREVFYGYEVDAWKVLDIQPITLEMVENDEVPTGEEWAYTGRLKEGGEVVEVIQDADVEKLLLLVTAFLGDGDDRSAQVVAMKMEHQGTLDKPGLLQSVQESES